MNAIRKYLSSGLIRGSGLSVTLFVVAPMFMTVAGRSQSTSAMTVAPPLSQTRAVEVTFSNQTSGTIVASWQKGPKVEERIGVILPNQAMELVTYPGHVTVFTSGKRRLATFRATSASNGAVFGIAGPGGGSASPVPAPPIVCGTPPRGGTNPGNHGQVTLGGIGGLIQAILKGTLGTAGGGAPPGVTPGGTPPVNQTDFAARLVGTTWTYVYGGQTFEFEFGQGQIKPISSNWWPGVIWKTNGKSQVQLKNVPQANVATLPPGPNAVNKTIDITFDSETSFKGIDFDGVTPIFGQRK